MSAAAIAWSCHHIYALASFFAFRSLPLFLCLDGISDGGRLTILTAPAQQEDATLTVKK